MRLLMEEWRKFLVEGSEERHAWNPHGSEPLSRVQRRSDSSYSNMGDEAGAALAAVGGLLKRPLKPREKKALANSGERWGIIVDKIRDADDKEAALKGLMEK